MHLTWIILGQVNYTYDAARGGFQPAWNCQTSFWEFLNFWTEFYFWNVTVQKFNLMDKESPNELQLEEFLMIEMFQMI